MLLFCFNLAGASYILGLRAWSGGEGAKFWMAVLTYPPDGCSRMRPCGLAMA